MRNSKWVFGVACSLCFALIQRSSLAQGSQSDAYESKIQVTVFSSQTSGDDFDTALEAKRCAIISNTELSAAKFYFTCTSSKGDQQFTDADKIRTALKALSPIGVVTFPSSILPYLDEVESLAQFVNSMNIWSQKAISMPGAQNSSFEPPALQKGGAEIMAQWRPIFGFFKRLFTSAEKVEAAEGKTLLKAAEKEAAEEVRRVVSETCDKGTKYKWMVSIKNRTIEEGSTSSSVVQVDVLRCPRNIREAGEWLHETVLLSEDEFAKLMLVLTQLTK